MGPKTPLAPPHPHVTVDDVWRGALPEGTQLVAGNAGTRREVVWCTTLRARQPAFTPLRGGELLLIDPQVLSAVDARLTLARLLDSLAGQGVAGAAVLGRVSPEARRAAETHALPLFALPGTLPLDQVEQQVLRFIVDERAELHERAQDLHRQLSELALAGRGLPALLARLHELTGVPVVLERDSGLDYVGGGRLAESAAALIAQERPALEEWLREVPLSAFDPPVALRPLAQGQARLIAPIMVQGSIAGFLSLLGSDGELGELHRLAVGRAAHACAIELVRAGGARLRRRSLGRERGRSGGPGGGASLDHGPPPLRSGQRDRVQRSRPLSPALRPATTARDASLSRRCAGASAGEGSCRRAVADARRVPGDQREPDRRGGPPPPASQHRPLPSGPDRGPPRGRPAQCRSPAPATPGAEDR